MKKILAFSLVSIFSFPVLTSCNNVTSSTSHIISTSQNIDEVITDAISQIRNALDLTNYRKVEQAKIEMICAQAEVAIKSADSIETINYLLKDYLKQLHDIPTKDTFPIYEQDEFLDFANYSMDVLNNYVSLDDYREAEQKLVKSCLLEAKEKIEQAKSYDELLNLVEDYKKKLKQIKTKNQYEEEEGTPMTIDDCKTTKQILEFKNLGYQNLYKDSNFKNGYIVTKSSYAQGESPYHEQYLRTYSSLNTPTWTIAQWNTRYDIMSNDEYVGGYDLKQEKYGLINTYTSKGKYVDGIFVPGKIIKANSITGELYLESNCSVEYEQHRQGSEPWVHLLYSQDFKDNLVYIKDTTSIVMDAEFTINFCKDYMGEAFNRNKHAAQLVWYITVQNRNRKSSGFGKYIWFGIPLWDNRTEGAITNPYIAHDAGTDTLIYNPSSSIIFNENNGKQPYINQKAHANIDVRPIIEQAFLTAKEKGYLANTNFDDLAIGGTNFGYEVPGTYDIGSTIHCINVFYK